MTATAAVGERPILFSGPMVCAILDGKKTQTRRVLKPQPEPCAYARGKHALHGQVIEGNPAVLHQNPYGQPGDRLWVRETCLRMRTEVGSLSGNPEMDEFMYADHPDYDVCWPVKGEAIDLGWRVCSSIHMPRFASRLSLEITGVRVERLHDITDDDAWDEGCHGWTGEPIDTGERWVLPRTNPREQYQQLWDSLNAKRGYGWDANPWVWVVEFRRVDP